VSTTDKDLAGKPAGEAVRGIDLQIERGICFGVLGPNGAGKTTTIEILEGLLEATSGEAIVFGKTGPLRATRFGRKSESRCRKPDCLKSCPFSKH